MTIFVKAKLFLQLLLCLMIKALCRRRPGRKKYPEIWLFSERGYDACDNAWALFQYVRTVVPGKKVYYILDRHSPEREKVKKCGAVLRRGSLRHLFLYFLPTVKISTHIFGAAPFPALFCSHVGRAHLAAPGAVVFLQHGVTCWDIPALYARYTDVDLFLCAAPLEYEFVKARFGYPEDAVCCSGFARLDALQETVALRRILFLPTWRAALASMTREAFLDTPYFSAVQSLLSDPQLSALLEHEKVDLVFAPHPEMRKFISCFCVKSPRISLDMTDIGEQMRKSAMLITDYSSVMFDFAYAQRPVIYWDAAGLRAPNYPAGYFSRERDGFGPVVSDLSALYTAVADTVRRGFSMEASYRERANRFFPQHDRRHCCRNYEAISAWIEKHQDIW